MKLTRSALVDTSTLGTTGPRRGVHVPRTRPPYPPEFRVETVRLLRSGAATIRQVSEDVGVSQQSLRVWIKQADLDEGRRDDGLTSAERDELRRLRREVRELREEREILRKAAVFFALMP
jgi:transposase